MSKRIVMLGLAVCFLMTTALAFAEDVYVTKRGKKYHKEDCRFIKGKEVQKIDKQEALQKGLVPCGKCFKEDVSALDSIRQDKQSLLLEEIKAEQAG
ncbi:MAG: hypothetical protein WC552_03715 [Candidatus Omnitrophota bacterium]